MKSLKQYSLFTVAIITSIIITLGMLVYIIYDSHYWPSDDAFAVGEGLGEMSWPDDEINMTSGVFPTADCDPGSIHLDTDETDDTNCTTINGNSLCLCVATDTWVALENDPEVLVYGGMVQSADPGSCNSISIGAQDVFIDADGFSTGLLSNMSFGSNALIIDSGMGGVYYIAGDFSFEGGTNSIYEFCASVNGSENVNCCSNRRTSNNDVGTISFSCILELSESDVVNLEIADHDTTPQDLNICDAQFNIFKLHQ